MGSYFQINELEAVYGNFWLGPLSLDMRQNEYLVILGPTGCGKTTLLQSIAGTYGRVKGEISLDSHNIGILPPQKRHIGYVSQMGNLFPHLTVRENVAFGLSYKKLNRKEKNRLIEHYLELFHLTKLSDHSAATLSGGESKRTAMARSLIVEPRLLLLDEPLGMLDHNGRKDMLQILKMIHDELQTTTIHVTHDRHEAWGIAQTCAVMNDGRIVQTGSVAELFRKPKSCFVAEFLGGVNIFKAIFEEGFAKLSWARLKLPLTPSAPEGWVLIRPESIHLTSDGKPSKVKGSVTGLRDFGEYVEIDIQVAELVRLKVHSSIEQAGDIVIGQTVFLDWMDESIHTFFEA
jgi:ABC-type Fe3+/spermidine/putrescine transport system ATPase subunit